MPAGEFAGEKLLYVCVAVVSNIAGGATDAAVRALELYDLHERKRTSLTWKRDT